MTKAAELAKMGEVLTNSQIGGRRNIIINGAMQVAQRGADINDVANGGFCTDRFKFAIAGLDELVLNLDQSTDAPTGFSNSLKLSVGTVESAISSTEYLQFGQRIEAQNLQHLKYGTSSAETLTLSFYVKSSITGTYAVSLYQSDASKYYSKTYTINSADTWEFKTIKISGNTANAINNDNGEGLRINWTLSTGSNFTSGSNDTWGTTADWAVGHNVSWITTSGATFYLTGVQLEVGEQATPFEHRSFGEELALCQRYYQKSYADDVAPSTVTNNGALWTNIIRNTSNQNYWHVQAYQTMRSSPSITTYSPATGTSAKFENDTDGADRDSAVSNTSSTGFSIRPNSGTNNDLGDVVAVHWVADSEL